MATEFLVDNLIDDGKRVVDQLVDDGLDVAAAFWVKTREEGLWHLYIASPMIDAKKPGEAYQVAYTSLSKVTGSGVQLSDLKLINDTNPIARDIIFLRDRYPAKTPTRYHGRQIGKLSIEEAYIYPPAREEFPGFDEIKKQFPSAEIFSLSIAIRDRNIMNSILPIIGPLIGKINQSEFEGKAPETLLFMGPKASSQLPFGRLVFVHRPEGWNKMFRADTQTWEEVVHIGTGKGLYETSDFSPLAALKATA